MRRFSVTWQTTVVAETAQEAAYQAARKARHVLYTRDLMTGEAHRVSLLSEEEGEDLQLSPMEEEGE